MHPPGYHDNLQVIELQHLLVAAGIKHVDSLQEPLLAKAHTRQDNNALPLTWRPNVNFSLIGPVKQEYVVFI